MADDWTPYALEKHRIRHLRRRRLVAILAAIAMLLLVSALFSVSTDRQTRISTNGRDTGSIEIQDVDLDKSKDDHITVEVQPGRVSRVEAGTDSQAPQVSRAQAPQLSRAAPYNWSFYLLLYGPYVLVGLLLWLLAKRRSRHDEVNYGVYKGAMPLELLTASHRDAVFTRKLTESSVFGKKRHDHLPRGYATAEDAEEE